jgi:hypothetical protein
LLGGIDKNLSEKKNGKSHKKNIDIKIGDFEMKAKQDYTMEEIDSMKEQLAESEWEGLKDRDKEYEETYLKQILWEGCVGWDNMEDEQVVELYEVHFEFED